MRVITLASNLVLPVSTSTETIAVLARKDGGKTYCGLKLFEEMHAAGAQCVSIDPVGKWWSLRLAADGKGVGIDLPIFGGQHGDLPLEPTGGALLAQIIVERGLSAVIDVSEFEDADMKRFVTDFARRLYRLKQRDQSVLHLFLEEASTFVPQDKEDGHDPPMLSALKKIARKGRNYGIGITFIDQRAQDVNKKVLNQASVLVVLGTSGTTDREAIEKWVRDKHIDASGLDELASLPQGDAFVWLPREKTFKRVHIAARWTFDASATPKLGAKRKERKLTPTDVSAIATLMAETVERAKANDPALLQQTVKALQARLQKGSLAPGFVAIEETKLKELQKAPGRKVEVPVVDKEDLECLERAIEKLDKLRDASAQAQQVTVSSIGNLRTLVEQTLKRLHSQPTPPPSLVKAVVHKEREWVAHTSGEEGLTRPRQRMLDVLASFEVIGMSQLRRSNLAVFSNQSPTSGGYGNNLGALRSRGFITYPSSDTAQLTEAGRAQAVCAEAMTLAGLHAAWLSKLPPKRRVMIEMLIKAYPEAMPREALAEATDQSPTSGGYGNNLGALRSLGIADYPSRDEVVATNLLFPPGLT